MGLPRSWLRDTALARALVPASWVFRFLARARRWYLSWRAARLSVPVVVVGSIFIGGTGKTPLVTWLVERAREQGFRPGIVLRGYAGATRLHYHRVGADSDPAVVGDEAVLLAAASEAPVVAGRDRVRAARALLRHTDCNLIISDDGLQHYRLHRDAEIIVLDAERALGNGYCLPAGPLREPVRRLQRADLVVINGGWIPRLTPHYFELDATRPQPVDPARASGDVPGAGEHVHAVAGIGAPDRFFTTLRHLGFRVTEHPFPDHYGFKRRDLAFPDGDAVLMTAKDAVKCRAFDDGRLWYLPARLVADRGFFAAASALLTNLGRRDEIHYPGNKGTEG